MFPPDVKDRTGIPEVKPFLPEDMFFLTSDPSRNWKPQEPTPLRLTPDKGSLNGVKLGGDPDSLQSFGKPSNRNPFTSESFSFNQMGLIVELEHARICYFGLVICPEDGETIRSCELTLTLPDGHDVPVSKGTTIEPILSALGQPSRLDRDETEHIYTYSRSGYTLELECTPLGKISRINTWGDF